MTTAMEYLQPKYRLFGALGALLTFFGMWSLSHTDPGSFGHVNPLFVVTISPVVGWLMGCSAWELCERFYYGEFQQIIACLLVGGLVGVACSWAGMYQAHEYLRSWPLGDTWTRSAIHGAAIGSVMCMLHPTMLKRSSYK